MHLNLSRREGWSFMSTLGGAIHKNIAVTPVVICERCGMFVPQLQKKSKIGTYIILRQKKSTMF